MTVDKTNESALLDLKGLTPVGVRLGGAEPRLQWEVGGAKVETDFDRFRPIRLKGGVAAGSLDITWQDFGDLAMDDPFFQYSLKRAVALPNTASPFRTSGAALAKLAAQAGVLPFSGAVFHMGRTGSTLIHRLLACTGKVQSISEIVLFDRALELTETWPEAERNAALQNLMAVYRRARRPTETQFVTKMAAATLWMPLFRAAFPDVPWIFVYREPVEVMVSAMRQPTGNIARWSKNRVQTARRLKMPGVEDPAMTKAEFSARLMRRVCRAAVQSSREAPPGMFLAVNYKRLPDAIWETIAPHFGIELTDEDRDRMRAEARFSSKRTDATEFKPDSATKQDEATPEMRALATRIVGPVYEELKALPQA